VTRTAVFSAAVLDAVPHDLRVRRHRVLSGQMARFDHKQHADLRSTARTRRPTRVRPARAPDPSRCSGASTSGVTGCVTPRRPRHEGQLRSPACRGRSTPRGCARHLTSPFRRRDRLDHRRGPASRWRASTAKQACPLATPPSAVPPAPRTGALAAPGAAAPATPTPTTGSSGARETSCERCHEPRARLPSDFDHEPTRFLKATRTDVPASATAPKPDEVRRSSCTCWTWSAWTATARVDGPTLKREESDRRLSLPDPGSSRIARSPARSCHNQRESGCASIRSAHPPGRRRAADRARRRPGQGDEVASVRARVAFRARSRARQRTATSRSPTAFVPVRAARGFVPRRGPAPGPRSSPAPAEGAPPSREPARGHRPRRAPKPARRRRRTRLEEPGREWTSDRAVSRVARGPETGAPHTGRLTFSRGELGRRLTGQAPLHRRRPQVRIPSRPGRSAGRGRSRVRFAAGRRRRRRDGAAPRPALLSLAGRASIPSAEGGRFLQRDARVRLRRGSTRRDNGHSFGASRLRPSSILS
jgi:hypothetical protein